MSQGGESTRTLLLLFISVESGSWEVTWEVAWEVTGEVAWDDAWEVTVTVIVTVGYGRSRKIHIIIWMDSELKTLGL